MKTEHPPQSALDEMDAVRRLFIRLWELEPSEDGAAVKRDVSLEGLLLSVEPSAAP